MSRNPQAPVVLMDSLGKRSPVSIA